MASAKAKLGDLVVAYARARMNKQVGDGECFALADAALRSAGAKSASDYGEVGDDTDYVWGDPIGLSDVAPGDILQFRDFDATTRVDTTKTLPVGGPNVLKHRDKVLYVVTTVTMSGNITAYRPHRR